MSSGNFFFTLLLFLGPIIAGSSSNWLICWTGMEISFLGLMPILISDKNFMSISKESSMKYFCIQAMGSGLLLLSGTLMFMLPINTGVVSELIFMVSLLIKLGVFPMHFWVLGVVSGLNWFPMLLILTWQKIAPLMFLSNLVDNNTWLMQTLLIISGGTALVGAIIGLNQSKIQPMLGASSISHSGWIIVGLIYGNFWIYFLIYCITLMFLISFLSAKHTLLSSLGILSLSGLPPFFMFLGKWSILKISLSMSMSFWYLLIPLLGSIMSLFFYLKFFYSFYLEKKKTLSKKLSLLLCFNLVSYLGTMFILLF